MAESPRAGLAGPWHRIFGRERGRPQPKGPLTRVETVRGYGPDIVRPPNDPFSNLDILDAETLSEIDRIRLMGQLDLAEHAQRVAAANAEAAQQRRAIGRDIGIQSNYRGLATDATNQGYDELIGTLEAIIPMTQQSYDTGVAQVGQAYSSGQANLAAPPVGIPGMGGADLSAQLQAIAGEGGAEFAANVNDPAAYMASLLGASGGQATAGLAALGAGDVAAARAALPGYREEQGEFIGDINLETDAALSDLRNQLSMVTPEFIPFNQAALQLRQEEAIRQAIEEGRNRRESDLEENYQGHRGVQNLAEDYGRPDLSRIFFDYYTDAQEAPPINDMGDTIPPDIALQRLINTHPARGPKGRRDKQILQQLLDAYFGNY